MGEYIMQIVTLSLLCGLCDLLTPAGEREGLRRAVRLVCGLCVLCVMVAPLREVRGWISAFDLGAWARETEEGAVSEYEKLMEEKLTVVTETEVCEAIYDLLAARFALSREDCTVSVGWDTVEDESLALREVWLSVRGRAVLVDPRALEAAVAEAVGCPCTVSVG